MYKLLLYYLIGLLVSATGLSFFGDLNYKPYYIVVSALILVVACWVINKIFAIVFEAPTNYESSIITALILSLIITPNPTGYGILFLLAASGLAMGSKYLITIRKKHIFNPAAIAVVLTALGPRQSASWWVGTAVMLPFVLIGGILITRKIHKERMVVSFLISTLLATIVYSIIGKNNVMTSVHNMILSSALFFLAFVMLTEPMTSPTTHRKQAWYGVLVGILIPPQAHLLKFYSSPELALIAGNIFSYIFSPKTKLFPTIKRKVRITPDSAEFIFNANSKFSYKPGQYMEWTLPHDHIDSRGSRRYLTLSSSPTESDIRIGVKFFEKGSSFKEALIDIGEDTPIVASQLSGDFVMPKDKSKKLVFIAGGIGITPFRSMVKYLTDNNERRSVVLLYTAKTEDDIAYRNIFEEARQKIGLQATYTITDKDLRPTRPNTRTGFITSNFIKQEVPDYPERMYYISGTHGMVVAIQKDLADLGIHKNHIKTDYFPGYA